MCKHENVTIDELGSAVTSHTRELDGEWSHNNDFGDYTGEIYIYCHQCGLRKTYRKKYPKWLENRMKEFLAA